MQPRTYLQESVGHPKVPYIKDGATLQCEPARPLDAQSSFRKLRAERRSLANAAFPTLLGTMGAIFAVSTGVARIGTRCEKGIAGDHRGNRQDGH